MGVEDVLGSCFLSKAVLSDGDTKDPGVTYITVLPLAVAEGRGGLPRWR